MLEHIGQNETAKNIRRAVDETLAAGKTLTPDIGGTATTEAYTKAVIERL